MAVRRELSAELHRLFESLRSSSLHRGEIAAQSASNLYTLCIDRIAVDNAAYCSSVLFAKDDGVLAFLQQAISVDELSSCKEELLKLLSDYIRPLENSSTAVPPCCLDIKNVCVSIFSRDRASKVRSAALQLLTTVLYASRRDVTLASQYDIPKLADKFFQVCLQPTKHPATVRSSVFQLLGTLCELYPRDMNQYAKRLVDIYTKTLKAEMMTKKKKPEMAIVSGCLRGLASYLTNFTQSVTEGSEFAPDIYRYTCMAIEPAPHMTRYEVPRAGLILLEKHAAQFREYLVNNYERVYKCLLSWCHHNNRECSRQGFYALESFFEQVSIHLTEDTNHKQVFWDLIKQFRSLLDNPDSGYRQLSVAVRGYSYFAAPCKVYGGDVFFMYNELQQRSEHMFLSASDLYSPDDKMLHLTTFIRALANIIAQLEQAIDCSLIKRLVLLLFECYPHMTSSNSDITSQSLLHLLSSLNTSGLQSFLNFTVYHGIILTCSHPVVIESVDDSSTVVSMDTSTGGPSYASYIDLWIKLMDPSKGKNCHKHKHIKEQVFNTFIESVMELISKLNLNRESIGTDGDTNQSSTDTSQYQESSAPQHPAVPKDFQVFINIVDLSRKLLAETPPDMFRDWVLRFGQWVVTMATKYPIVSGFYKLLGASFKICSKCDYFKDDDTTDDKQQAFVTFQLFTREVAIRMQQFREELQYSCLQALLALPSQIVECELATLVPALQVSLTLGLSYTPLARAVVEALETWFRSVPIHHLSTYLPLLVPAICDYLHNSSTGDTSATVVLGSSSFRRQGRRKIAIKRINQSNKNTGVCQRMVYLLGSIGGYLAQATNTSSTGDAAVVWDCHNKLLFELPFPDMKPSLQLDCFLPIVCELATGSSSRQIKVAACEFLHAVILFITGKTAHPALAQKSPMALMFRKLCPVMLQLACDADQVVEQLFRPLTFQLIHWYTRNTRYESTDTMALLDSILECIEDPSNSSLREFSASCVCEYLLWSIKQTSSKQQDKAPGNTKSLLKRLYSMASHPSSSKRLGAALALNSIYTVFREDKTLVDMFILELLVVVIKSLIISSRHGDTSGCAEQYSAVVGHFIRIIRAHSVSLVKHSDTRRVPRGLKEATLDCVLQWCVSGCGYPYIEARKQCMRLVTELAPVTYRLPNVRAWIRRTVESDGYQYFISRFESGGCDNGGISTRPVSNTLSWLEDLHAAIDCYIMMLNNQYVSLSELFPSSQGSSQLFNSIGHFLNQFTSFVRISSDGGSTARVVLGLLELVTVILTKHTSQASTHIPDTLWECPVLYQVVLVSLFNPPGVGCPPGDTACEQDLVSAATSTLTAMVSSQGLLASLQDNIMKQIGSGGPHCLLTRLPVQLESLANRHMQFDRTVSGHIVLMDNGLLAHVLDAMGLTQSDVVSRIMESIVNPTGTESLSPAVGNTYKILLELAFVMSASDITQLLSYILSDNTDKSMVHQYIIHHLDTAVLYLMKQAAHHHITVLQLLCDLLESPGSHAAGGVILANFSMLSCWWTGKNCNDTTKLSAATLFNKILSQHCNQQQLVSSDSVALNMYTQLLMDPNNTLTMKSKILEPLKYLMSSSDEIAELVKKSLEQLVADQFPLKSTEYSPGTSAYNEYITVIDKLSDVLVKSGSHVLLRLLVNIMCREDQHAAETVLLSGFRSLMIKETHSACDGVRVLQLVYDMFTNAHSNTARRVAGEKVCVHIMRESKEPTLVEFCRSNISTIMATIEERTARGPALQSQLLSKLCCFQFIEVMYSRLSPDIVSSSINAAYCSGKTQLTGKELTQAATKAAHAVKQDDKRGELMELRRQYHCHAYNMLVAIISCTQTKIQFYTTFLFKEDLNKGVILWDSIIDPSKIYHFECELENPVQRKKVLTAIRDKIHQQQHQSNGGSPSPQYISSLYLTDSSLSADVSMYDFSSAPVQQQSSEVEVSSYMITEEEIEQDDLNTHECMTVIMRLLDHMEHCGVTPAVHKGSTELPSWMAALHKKMTDTDTHINVRLFIARIITNRPKVFQPYATYWLPVLAQLVLGDNNGLHCFTVDVIATMLSWATTAILEDRYLANRLLQYCMNHAHNSNKAIFRNNLEIVRSMVECWSSVLQVPTKLIYDQFNDTNKQSKMNRTGVQLLGVMVANSKCPYNPSTAEGLEEFKFYNVLANNIFNHYKEVYAATAEVLGVCLRQLDHAGNPLIDQLRIMVCDQLSMLHSQSTSEDRFITALHSLNYTPISSRFVDKLLFFLPSLSGVFLTMCLEILHSQVEIRSELYHELKEKGILQLLVHRDSATQLASLQLVEGMIDRLSIEMVCEVIPHVTLQPHHTVPCRRTACNILIRAYTRLSCAQNASSQPVIDKWATAAKEQLLHGLYDDSDEIRNKVFNYWNQDANLGTGTLERLGRLLPVLYSAHTEQHFLPYCTSLLLELTSRSPDYSRMMFDQPLSECKFNDYKTLDLSWQHRHHHMMPLFAASQSLADGSVASSMTTGMVRATQQSLAFTPTQEQGEYNWMAPTVQSMDVSSFDTAPPTQSTALLFSMAPPKTRPFMRAGSIDTVDDKDEEQRKKALRLKRRFLKNPSASSKFFAKREARKKIAREDNVRRQKAARSSQVVMYRQYRDGELPDIQIKNAELIRPLQALAQHDSVLARQLFTTLFTAVLGEQRGLTEREIEELYKDLQQTMDNVLDSSIHYYPPLVGSLQEICFGIQCLQLQPSLVASASTVSMQQPTGIMLLERQLLTGVELATSAPKRLKRDTAEMSATTETWLELARLYKSLEEYDVLNGVFTNLDETSDITHRALLAEERSDYVTASQLYKEALEKDWGDRQPLQEEEDLWDGSLLMCYSELTRWEELSDTVDACIDGLHNIWTDAYNQERYLPHMLKARVKLCCCGNTDSKLASFLQRSLTNEDHRAVLESRYCYELCLMSILQDDINMTSHYLQCCIQAFYQDWMSISKLQSKALSSRLQRLQLLSDVRDYMNDSTAPVTKASLTDLLERWRNRYPHQRLDPLAIWDDVITARCMMMRKMTVKAMTSPAGVEELVSREYVSMYLKIADTARVQGNYPVAKRYLELTDKALKSISDDGCFGLQSLHGAAKLVIQIVSCDLSPSHCDQLIDLVHKLTSKDDHDILRNNTVLACCHHQLSGQALSLMADIISAPNDGLVALQSLTQSSKLTSIIGRVDTTNPALVSNKLWVRVMSSFKASIHVSKVNGSPNTDSLMEMASFCDKILRREDNEDYHSGLDTKQFPDIVISYVLIAMAQGSPVARQQFPHLLQLLEAYPSSCDTFVRKSGSVPCWMFLAWLGQLVALLDKNEATAVHGILETIANTYPRALCYPLKISIATLVFDSSAKGIARKESFDKLLDMVHSPLVDKFIEALEQLNSPEQSWKDRCDVELKPLMHCSQRDKAAILKIWQRIYSSMFEQQETESMGQLAKRFAKTHSKKVESKFGHDGSHILNMTENTYNAAVADLYKKMKEGQSQSGPSALLQQYSPWLAGFQDTQYQEMLEIPGQYTGQTKPLPEYHIMISSFDERVLVMASLRKPKRISIRGSDARDHLFLVKCGEDLRLDQRIEQLYEVMNGILREDPACCQRELGLATYQVIPMTARVGIIQWMDHTKPLKNFLEAALEDVERNYYKRAFELHHKFIGGSTPPDYMKMYRNQRITAAECAKSYRKRVDCVPWNLLRRAFLRMAVSPEAFLVLRSRFVCSHATLSMCQYVLGIGDRHLSNFLINEQTGAMIGIDFGHAFGSATQILPIPELLPFRLTPQITNLLLPHKESGQLRSCMTHTLRALRHKPTLLLNTMDVFIKEPHLEWKNDAIKQAEAMRKEGGDEDQEEDSLWYPRERVAIAHKKLQGYDSRELMLEDLYNGHKGKPKEYAAMKSVLLGKERKQPSRSVEDQVAGLISHATDPNILARTYQGWNSWV